MRELENIQHLDLGARYPRSLSVLIRTSAFDSCSEIATFGPSVGHGVEFSA